MVLSNTKSLKKKGPKKQGIIRKRDIEEGAIEITRNSPEQTITEIDLRDELRKKGLIKEDRKSLPYTYYKAINQAISEGRLGEDSTITRTRRGRKAVRVFRYIKSLEDKFNEIFAVLDYNAGEGKFGEKLGELPPKAISILLGKLGGLLYDHSATPAVIGFIVSALGNERLAAEREILIACLSQAVNKAVEVGNKPLLAKINENVKWLECAMVSGTVDKITGATILLKLKNPGGLDTLLGLFDNDHLYQYDMTNCGRLVLSSVSLFPQERERIKQNLIEKLREDEGKKTPRKFAAEYILKRI